MTTGISGSLASPAPPVCHQGVTSSREDARDDPAPAPQAVPSRRRGELTLPPLPQLAEAQAELSRLGELVEQRAQTAAAARAAGSRLRAPTPPSGWPRSASSASRRPPPSPEAQAAAEAAERELSDTRAALQVAVYAKARPGDVADLAALDQARDARR